MFDFVTLNDVLEKATGWGSRAVMMGQGADGAWKPITSDELYGRVRALVEVLRGWGVGKGDRVAILSENRWEWPVTDFATLAIGAVDVPLYPTLTPEQIGYMLRDSGAKVAVLSSREQYDKLAAAGDLPELERVVVMDAGEFANAESFGALMEQATAKQQKDAGFDGMLKTVKPEDLATIIYTSGTTGEPKGVMLTHGNMTSNVNFSTGKMGFSEKDSCISFLPLSHVTARHTDYALLSYGVKLAYCPKFDQLAPAMQAVKPTVFLAVPRVYEKDSAGGGGEVGCVTGEVEDTALGAGSGEEASGGDIGWEDAWFAELEDGEQAGVLEDSRGVWRAGGGVYLGRCAAGDGFCRVVRGCGDTDL
ncbi:AMP-binding protein [Tunturiibacter empetritectus]|uniref:AMP-binding protein n=1 Tax=Tunturiibacter empetritectus TaxID=3069691 RepID=UPI003D9B53EA